MHDGLFIFVNLDQNSTTEASPQQNVFKTTLLFFLLIFPNTLNFNDQKSQPAEIDMHSSERQYLAPMEISVLFLYTE